MLFGERVAALHAPVPGDATLVVFAWPVGCNWCKIYGGAAVANQAGGSVGLLALHIDRIKTNVIHPC